MFQLWWSSPTTAASRRLCIRNTTSRVKQVQKEPIEEQNIEEEIYLETERLAQKYREKKETERDRDGATRKSKIDFKFNRGC